MTVTPGNGQLDIRASDFARWSGRQLLQAPFDPDLGEYCLIPLHQYGGIVARAAVSPEDFDRFGHLKWSPNNREGIHWGRPVHYQQPVYAARIVRGRTIFLHKEILGITGGNIYITGNHINGYTLDCRRENLEIIPKCLNGRRRRRYFTGITIDEMLAGKEYWI